MAQDGLARAVRPSHTLMDGDTIFALACGEIQADTTLVGAFAAEMFTQAILNAVRTAQPAGGFPVQPALMPMDKSNQTSMETETIFNSQSRNIGNVFSDTHRRNRFVASSGINSLQRQTTIQVCPLDLCNIF